jgi:hypothetical protein
MAVVTPDEDNFFFYRLYDERSLRRGYFPSRASRRRDLRERSRGILLKNLDRKMADPLYPHWREPYMMGRDFRYFDSLGDLPGDGVIGLDLKRVNDIRLSMYGYAQPGEVYRSDAGEHPRPTEEVEIVILMAPPPTILRRSFGGTSPLSRLRYFRQETMGIDQTLRKRSIWRMATIAGSSVTTIFSSQVHTSCAGSAEKRFHLASRRRRNADLSRLQAKTRVPATGHINRTRTILGDAGDHLSHWRRNYKTAVGLRVKRKVLWFLLRTRGSYISTALAGDALLLRNHDSFAMATLRGSARAEILCLWLA